ncbi:uncharacterized protein L969DRAFT_475072 [Mixia osmundae IAM 14324]|uniref:uncharacterized protein n=1 Tax=Mixia osmundae (strain CBS 9802 / IAM 14324 / JCM 22182 / KY 12970) TaxID=764103 RepID=UPI0004A55169|nr:uncharacterized protein L969DRAFT_475072 [Mixia osmundae IAM 14324]KEI38648.1 hypothetical protein L969DRAFT_475072 [Mixia osmundae IAM 14324]
MPRSWSSWQSKRFPSSAILRSDNFDLDSLRCVTSPWVGIASGIVEVLVMLAGGDYVGFQSCVKTFKWSSCMREEVRRGAAIAHHQECFVNRSKRPDCRV